MKKKMKKSVLLIWFLVLGNLGFAQLPEYVMIANPNGNPGAFVVYLEWPSNAANTNVRAYLARSGMLYDANAGTPTVTGVQGTWTTDQTASESTIDAGCGGASNNPNNYSFIDVTSSSTIDFGNVSAGAVDTVYRLQFPTTSGVTNIELLEGVNGSGGSTALDNCLTGAGYQAILQYRPTSTGSIATQALDQTSAVLPLPVELFTYSAKWKGDDALVEWSTAAEINNSHFELWRSLDGVAFTYVDRIGSMSQNGNSNSILNYTYSDDNIKQYVDNSVFYRLYQVDFDGQRIDEGVTVLNNSKDEKITIEAWPVPSEDIVHVKVSDSDGLSDVTLTLLDMHGKSVYSNVYARDEASTQITLSLKDYAKGMYKLKISSKNKIEVQTLLKM